MYWGKITPKTRNDVAELNRSGIVYEIPEPAMLLASATHILSKLLGFSASAESQTAVLGDGTPIPLMSYSLIEYLLGLDLSDAEVLEIGAGSSTAFWAKIAKSVLSLETNPEWAESVRKSAAPNCDVRATTEVTLARDMLDLKRNFDVIVIDPAANRYRCAASALKMLKAGGFIVLDNSDWYPNTAKLLREADLIEIDFHDFRPNHHYRCTASLFLHREFRATPKTGRLPLSPIGGKEMASHNTWDRPNG
jgi:predicted O-methyltransferase YrrM